MNLKLFNDSLTSRYYTLERNIKSKSNSFYDSYLDLLEATIKYFLDENSVKYDPTRTCGHIVKENEIALFFKEVLMLDEYTYNKLPDYIKKCNDHKHKKEKQLQVESVINYLKVYFDFINYYIEYIKGIRVTFNSEYYVSIYGETEKLNREYKLELQKLKEELKELYDTNKLSEIDLEQYKTLLSVKEIEMFNLEEQNLKLQSQISVLKDIKLNSLEEKLNKALEMLTNLNEDLLINRVVSDAILRMINGETAEQAIERLSKERK